MSKILLSINPEHVENILQGVKRFEYRKIKCRKDIDMILIYSTAPIMKVVGEAEVIGYVEGEPEEVWMATYRYSGINKNFFDQYYSNRKKAVAYRLGKIRKYKSPIDLSDLGVNCAPQSFVYID